LVNVHIRECQSGGAVVDAAALSQFQKQWATYRKLVENDCLAHREVGGILRKTLDDVFTFPFHFLDISLRRCEYDENRALRNPGPTLSWH
jgi:hypothetical protein